jgi:hypothetical protein
MDSQGSIEEQAEILEIGQTTLGGFGGIPEIVTDFGTRHFHLVAHSKGGLDSKKWLTDFKGDKDSKSNKLIIGQFITMNTPHMGSVVADYAYGSASLTKLHIAALLARGPTLRYPFMLLAGIAKPDIAKSPATHDLQTHILTQFNYENLPKLFEHKNAGDDNKTKPTFLATASDSDIVPMRGVKDGRISLPLKWEAEVGALCVLTGGVGSSVLINKLHTDVAPPFSPPSPDETAPGVKWEGGLVGELLLGTIGSRMAYEALGDIQNVTVNAYSSVDFTVAEEPLLHGREVNDFLVTKTSALFPGSPFVSSPSLFFQGKMHGNVCDDEVAAKLLAQPTVFPPTK